MHRSRLTTLARAAAAAVLTAGLLGTTALAAPTASAMPDGVYSVPYEPTLYLHEHGPLTTTQPLDEAGWRAAQRRYPTITPAPVEFVHYTWSPHVYAVVYLDPFWTWRRLSLTEWLRAGAPQPRVAGHIDMTRYVTFGDGSGDIYATLDGIGHKLTYDEWAASGFRRPGRVIDGDAFKLAWGDGVVVRRGSGFVHLTYAEWQALGFPRPTSLPMLPGDRVCRVDGGPDLRYESAAFTGVLTFDQWVAAGAPAPTC